MSMICVICFITTTSIHVITQNLDLEVDLYGCLTCSVLDLRTNFWTVATKTTLPMPTNTMWEFHAAHVSYCIP